MSPTPPDAARLPKPSGTSRKSTAKGDLHDSSAGAAHSGAVDNDDIVFVGPWGHSAWALLGQRRFRLFFFGTLTSNLGTWLQSTAQIVISYQVTHSIFIVGAITSAQFAGMIVVSPWAAVIADRVGTKNLLIGAQVVSALIAVYMAWCYHNGELGVHRLIFCALSLGLAFALALPVQTALIPLLVDPSDATNAVKMNSVSYNAGRAFAPVLSVLLIASLGPDLIFVLNAISFIVFAFCLANILPSPKRAPGKTQISPDQKDPAASERAHVTDGFKTALRHRRILLLLAIVAAVTFADDPIFVLSPALAHAKFQVSGQWAGYFIAALGWGSVLGSLPLTSKKDNAKQASKHAAIGLVILSTSVLIFTKGISPQISLMAAFAAGAAGLYTGTAAQTALLVHQKKKAVISVASVAALWAIAWAGTKPFASLLDGLLATHLGLAYSAFILVLPALVIAFGQLVIPSFAKKKINAWAGRVISTLRFRLSHHPAQPHPLAVHRAPTVALVTQVIEVTNDGSRDYCGQVDVLLPSHVPTG